MSVWLCPGQGAQKVGMGADLLKSKSITEVFEVLSDALGVDLIKLAKEGTQEELNETVAAQGLTMAVSVGVGQLLQSKGINPDAIIGFSLGQISALVLAGVLSLEDAAQLLKVRSSSMARDCADKEGGMLALIGADLQAAQELCDKASEGDILVCANHNGPSQVVISGTVRAIERAQQIWSDEGKKSARLATAGAFHSPMMENAAADIMEFCETLTFQEPKVTLICNTDAKPFVIAEASKRLADHAKGEVLFEESVRAMLDEGQTEFVEIGYGNVLTNLVKRIDRSTERHLVGTETQLHEYMTNNAS